MEDTLNTRFQTNKSLKFLIAKASFVITFKILSILKISSRTNALYEPELCADSESVFIKKLTTKNISIYNI